MTRILLTTFLLSTYLLYGQATLEQGYFIDNEGNRTDCLIENLDWGNHPKSFKYRLSKKDDLITRTLDNTIEFGFGITRFKRFEFPTAQMANTKKEIENKKEIQFNNTVAFLKILIDGSKQLLSHMQTGVCVYYIRSENQEPNPLIYTKYRISESDIRINEEFKKQLLVFLDCDLEESAHYKNLSYTQRSLKKLFFEYSKCSGKIIYDKNNTEPRSKKSFYLLASVGLNINNVTTSYRSESLDLPINTKATFAAGVAYNFPFYRNKLSVLGKVSTNKFNSTTEASFVIPTTVITRNELVNFEYSSIDIAIGARHHSYINTDWNIFFNAYYAFPITENAEVTINQDIVNTRFNKGNFIVLGVGVDYKNIELNIEPFSTRNYSSGIKNNYSSISLGYKF